MSAYKPFDYETYKPVLCDSTGKKLTSGLFVELADPTSVAKPVFKLEDWRKTYVDIADPTDYKAAAVLIGNWEHWQALLQCKPFLEHLEKWREEVEVKLKSEAVAELRKQAKHQPAAAKWLADKGYLEKKRGRPVKEQGAPESNSRVAKDAKRLALVGSGKT